MTILNRMLKLRQITVSTKAGDDPDAIDEAMERVHDYPEIDTPCDKSPSGQCEYNSEDRFYFDKCLHCKKLTG